MALPVAQTLKASERSEAVLASEAVRELLGFRECVKCSE